MACMHVELAVATLMLPVRLSITLTYPGRVGWVALKSEISLKWGQNRTKVAINHYYKVAYVLSFVPKLTT